MEILINVEHQETRVAVVKNKQLEELYVERKAVQRLVGNIYLGKVQSVLPGIGAAFVDLGLNKNGFLLLEDFSRLDSEKISELVDVDAYQRIYRQQGAQKRGNLRRGQNILVQVTKDPLGMKGPRLTTHIALAGRYLVLMPRENQKAISRKIAMPQERKRLREILNRFSLSEEMGLIVRTAARHIHQRNIQNDLGYLLDLWNKIKKGAEAGQAPLSLHYEYDLIFRTVRDLFSYETSNLIIDSVNEFKKVRKFISLISPNLIRRIRLYRGSLALFEKKNIEDEIAKIYQRKIELKSGGYITIEPTEGLVAIDVNTGSFRGKRDIEHTAFLVNQGAACEISRQIRLRDLGGIIIVDFIDMKKPEHRRTIYKILESELKKDRAKTEYSKFSQLGLIEISRQRTRKSLESIFYQSCPYCSGRGSIKSAQTLIIQILKDLRKNLSSVRRRSKAVISAHPYVVSKLLDENRLHLQELEKKFRVRILAREDANFHIEDVRVDVS